MCKISANQTIFAVSSNVPQSFEITDSHLIHFLSWHFKKSWNLSQKIISYFVLEDCCNENTGKIQKHLMEEKGNLFILGEKYGYLPLVFSQITYYLTMLVERISTFITFVRVANIAVHCSSSYFFFITAFPTHQWVLGF